jgi:hypothetical protein
LYAIITLIKSNLSDQAGNSKKSANNHFFLHPKILEGGFMFKSIVGIIFSACLMANASSKTVPLFLKDTLTVNNDSILWITTSQNLNDSYRHGEVLVGIGTTTLRDSTYRILHNITGSTNILINLYDLMRRYYSEQSTLNGTENNVKVGPEQAAIAKKNGINWRISPVRTKK